MAKIPVAFVVLVVLCVVYGVYEYVSEMASFQLEAVHGGSQKKNITGTNMSAAPPMLQQWQQHLQNLTAGLLEDKPKDQASEMEDEEAALTNQSISIHDSSSQLMVATNATSLAVDFSAISGGNATLKSLNHFELMQKGGHFGNWTNALPPVQLLTSYIQEHSQQALERTWIACGNQTCPQFDGMKFVVGRYSCPLEAGNRMFKYMNHLIWAIVTNRVFLGGYWDKDACLAEVVDTGIQCETLVNVVADCKDILHQASWVPSWDEWSLKLNLTEPVRACAIGMRNRDPIAIPMDGGQVPRVIRVGQQLNLELGSLMNQRKDRKLLRRRQTTQRAAALFRTRGHLGLFFTYGMLFESLFTLDVSLMPESNILEIDSNKVNSYVLHSRHQTDRDSGLDTHLDESCMNKVLVNRTSSKPCIVYTMTDRQLSKELLPKLLREFNCSAIFANTNAGTSQRFEHGPFAGRGYFQDLALVQNARQGFMSPNSRARPRVGPRTSTGLPRSIIEFRRVLESSSNEDVLDFRQTFFN